MGAFASRQNAGVEELDIAPNHAYRYPPKSGCYFGSYFIMGGERFESTQPEAYLFGENQDLNFLGARPLPFPYPAPQSNEPTKTIKSLVNIRKDSLRLIRLLDDETAAERTVDAVSQRLDTSGGSKDGVSLKCGVEIPSPEEDVASPAQRTTAASSSKAKYNIEFTFDADARCAITIYYFVTESIEGQHAVYLPRDSAMSSETYRYKAGANQQFVQTAHVLEPGRWSDEDWHLVGGEKDVIPIVIQCVVEDEEDHVGHSHMTFACVERTSDGYAIKALKQKQMVDGLCYLLQEIYGIENKKSNVDASKGVPGGGGGGGGDVGGFDDADDDNGSECVICMSDVRDTLILPCRHLCLCNGCADSLRYQANNCPICRAPFRALLQIRAMRKKMPNSVEVSPEIECPVSQEGCPPGYEAISLIEALNGPSTPTHRVLSSDVNGVSGGGGDLSVGVVHATGVVVGDVASLSAAGAISGVALSSSSVGEAMAASAAAAASSCGAGGVSQTRPASSNTTSSTSAHRSKRRTSSGRAGSGRGSTRSAIGSPLGTDNSDQSQSTPSTTPLLHHSSAAAARKSQLDADDEDIQPASNHAADDDHPLRQNRSLRCSSSSRDASTAGAAAKASNNAIAAAAAAAGSVPRCRSVEDESDFAIVSIPARRARIAKMGEDVESLGSAMSESPSCDGVVVARPASSSFPAVFVPAAAAGKESGNAAADDDDDAAAGVNFIGDDADLEGAVTPPAEEEEAETPVSPTTPIGGGVDVIVEAVRSADDDPDVNADDVEIVGTASPASRPTPVAADV